MMAEPWILLPLVYARRAEGIGAEYSQQTRRVCALGVRKRSRGWAGLRSTCGCGPFVQDLYADAAEEGATAFLDKTPLNYLNVADGDLLRSLS